MENPDGQAIAIRNVDLSNFRNYANLRLCLRLESGPGPIVLTGANGAGKTNLLEAISMFMPGRGMRGAGFDAMLFNAAATVQWAVSISIEQFGEPLHMGTSWQQTENGESQTRGQIHGQIRAQTRAQTRLASIDRQPAKGVSAFGDHIRLIWLTPAMDRLFAGPASDRRRFLDRIVAASDPGHRQRLNSFEKLMRQRNALLAEGNFDGSWMSIVEQQMAEQAIAIAAARLAAIDVLQGHIDKTLAAAQQSVFPASRLTLAGDIEACLRRTPAVQSEDEYAKILHDSRKIDQAAGRTLKGPHRSDLIVYHSARDMEARACSTGEQKALLVGLVLAQAKMVQSAFGGQMPVLLLDEIAAHLDKDRRKGLFDELIRAGSQCWLTGTDKIQFEALQGKAQFFTVTDGMIQQG